MPVDIELNGVLKKRAKIPPHSWYKAKIWNRSEYQDLCVQSDTLLLATQKFKSFRDICLEIYDIVPAHFLSAPRLAWQAAFKKSKFRLNLLTDVDTWLMVETGIKGKICRVIHRYAKSNDKYMINYDKKTIIISEVLECK